MKQPPRPKGYTPCGAKLRNGQPCAKPPLAGETRCRLHGGATKTSRGSTAPQAKPGTGLYTKFYTAAELAAHEAMELGTVDAEIKLVRIRLARALKMEELDAAGELEATIEADNGRPRKSEELESRIMRDGGGENTVREERHYRKIDYRAAIAVCLTRIESLERTRAELAKLAKDDDPHRSPIVLMTRVITSAA